MLQLLHLLFDADEVSLALVIDHIILGTYQSSADPC